MSAHICTWVWRTEIDLGRFHSSVLQLMLWSKVSHWTCNPSAQIGWLACETQGSACLRPLSTGAVVMAAEHFTGWVISLTLLETIYPEFLLRAFIFVVYFIFMHISSCCTFTSICIRISCLLHGLYSATLHWCDLSGGALKSSCGGSCSSMIPMGLSSWECLLWRQTAVPVTQWASGCKCCSSFYSIVCQIRFPFSCALDKPKWLPCMTQILIPMENVCW